MSAPSRALLVAAAGSLALVVAFAPAQADRRILLIWGLAGLAAVAAIAAAPSLDIVLLIVLAVAVLQAAFGSARRPLEARLRAPVLAVALLAVGLEFARFEGPPVLARFAAVGLVAGLAATLGTLPYIHQFDPDELTAASPIAWIGYVGPVLALAVVSRAGELIPAAGAAFGAMLIGLGLINILWGGLATWQTEKPMSAWHYSFMADWGLILCGLGLHVVESRGAAVILLYGLLLGRLPLYIWSRQAIRERSQNDRPVNLLVAAMLAGSAPFAGFAARVLLLRGATELYWPLALVLALGLLLWLPGSLRLGRSLGSPRGRQLIGIGVSLALNVGIGLYPQPILSLAGS